MKIWSNKTLGAILGASVLMLTGCVEGEEVFDQIRDAEQRGAILRTIDYPASAQEIPIGDSNYMFELMVEEQDQQGGDLLGSVEVFVGFLDNTVEAGAEDLDRAESLFATIPASDFTIGEFGLPRGTFSASLSELLSFVGLTEADIFVTGGDQFTIRLELVLTDGRRFSNDDNSGTITGSYFSSPFFYLPVVVCPPQAPTPGTWMIEMQDSYGDGWNGASLDITVDGETTSFLIADGFAASETLEVADGASSLGITFNSGDWDSEITFQVISANGNTILDLGPEPSAGVELLDYCDLNLGL